MVTQEEIDYQFGKYKDKKLTRQSAIKIYCRELCCSGDYRAWADCPVLSCPLWRFRKGRELCVNEGSFGVRGRIDKEKEKSVEKPGKIRGFRAKNNELWGGRGNDKTK